MIESYLYGMAPINCMEWHQLTVAWGVAVGAFAGGCSGYNGAMSAQGVGNPKADLTSVIAGVDTDIVGNVAGKVYKETK